VLQDGGLPEHLWLDHC